MRVLESKVLINQNRLVAKKHKLLFAGLLTLHKRPTEGLLFIYFVREPARRRDGPRFRFRIAVFIRESIPQRR